MFFCDGLSIPRDFLAVFDLNSSFSLTWSTFLNDISFASFKIWIFSNDDVVSFFAFIGELTIRLRTIFYHLILRFRSFFFDFKFAGFLIEGCGVFYRSLRTFFDDFCFTCFKLWVVSVFSIVTKFSFLHNWFHTNSNDSIFLFSDRLCRFCGFSNWFRVLDLLGNGNFFLAWFSFFFNLLETSFKVFVIDYLRFIRNFPFDRLSRFTFSRLSTYLDESFLRLFRSLKFAFFSFYNFSIFDYKRICSFLFSWRTWSYNFFFTWF